MTQESIYFNGLDFTYRDGIEPLINIGDKDFARWLADTLLPSDEREAVEVVGDVLVRTQAWKPADVADGIGSIIGRICIEVCKDDLGVEREFTRSRTIRQSVGIRRGSRVNSVRNREKMRLVLTGLLAAIRIAFDILREIAGWRARRWESEDMSAVDGPAYDARQDGDNFPDDISYELELSEMCEEDAYFESFVSPGARQRTRDDLISVRNLDGLFRGHCSGRRNAKRNPKDVRLSKGMKALRREDGLSGAEASAA